MPDSLSLADAAVAAFEKLTPKHLQGTPPKSALRADAKVPFLFPQGPGDAIQSTANPCFVTSGAPPAKGACVKTAQPPTLIEGYAITFTKAGTYDYLCTVHDNMEGKVVVH